MSLTLGIGNLKGTPYSFLHVRKDILGKEFGMSLLPDRRPKLPRRFQVAFIIYEHIKILNRIQIF
jgi:hypothetical protein